MSALSGALMKPCLHIFIGFSFLSYDVTNVYPFMCLGYKHHLHHIGGAKNGVFRHHQI